MALSVLNRLGRAGTSGIIKKLWMIRMIRVRSEYATIFMPYSRSVTRLFSRMVRQEGSSSTADSNTPMIDSRAMLKNFRRVM